MFGNKEDSLFEEEKLVAVVEVIFHKLQKTYSWMSY
jgi:hypothetical protein